MSREFDIIVFGATGFTGGLTAEYLAAHAPPELRWAIAGRSQQKLDALKARLSAQHDRCRALGTVVASVDDDASLQAMAARTRVLLTTVGPFIDYGEAVVRACVEQKTDYIDSTGEPNFVQGLLARYGESARQANVRIVSSCGFDSIPADLGALFTVQQLPADRPIALSCYVRMQGVFSGGTERSAIKSLAPSSEAPAPSVLELPGGRRARLVTPKTRHDAALGGWTSPLPTIDASIVLRSAASLPQYGPDFSYAHHVVHASFLHMFVAFWVFGGLALLARFAPMRALLLKLVKQSGQGPTEEQRSRGWFKHRFIAECDGKTVQTEVSGGDPGYGETSKMLAESAMCLALDGAALPARAGVLTTAEAMGDVLIARLQRAGLSFQVM
jgi:short subunit dehydrogenase-like uncharacterized protein